jgi:hypothetical protein
MEGPHGGCLGTLEKGIVRECDRAGQAHFRHLLQGLLQGQSKEWRPEGVALPHPTLRPHHLFGVLDEQAAVLAIRPRYHGKQGRAALCDGGQHAVAAHGVKRILPVDLHGDAARVGSHTSAQGVAEDLAAARNAYCKL